MELRVYKRISVYRPTMLAAWPGMGNVGFLAIDYLRRALKAELFAEIDASELLSQDAVRVEDGLAKLPALPRNVIYYRNSPDLIIFLGEVQLRGKSGTLLVQKILELVNEFRASKIFTAAAFPMPISCLDPSTVYGAATTKSLRDLLYSEYQIKIMEQGEISGLNGLLLGYAREIDVPAACLLATMPLYAAHLPIPNPKASREIVRILSNVLSTGSCGQVNVPMADLDLQVEQIENELSEIEDRLKEDLAPAPSPKEASGEIPPYVLQRIERLFREAKDDKHKANRLKEELDKWNLFDSYEDRFLDLFKGQ